jgi:WhiB family redox-sensing transcriptional regulator
VFRTSQVCGTVRGRATSGEEAGEEAVVHELMLIDGMGEDEGALSWQERSLCAQTDPEAFFPEKGGSTREAKKVCIGCEVRAECLEYALANDERFGIWGGLSERERRKLKKRAV